METWLILLLTIGIVAVLIIGLSFLSSVAIMGASKRYLEKERQADTEMIQKALPGSDCGACGLGSCEAYARQCAENRGFVKECPHLSQADKTRMEEEFSQREETFVKQMEQGRANRENADKRC